MDAYYDDLETRTAEARAESLRECLPALIATAMALPGYAESLARVQPAKVTAVEDLAALPVLRHRVQLAPEVAIGGQDVDEILKGLVESVPAPRQ